MEDRIRALLRDRAEDVTPPWELPRAVERRARRRALLTVATGLITAAAVVVASVVAVRSITRADRVVPVHPTPSPVSLGPIPPLLHNGPLTLVGLIAGLRELPLNGTGSTALVRCSHCTWTKSASWTADGSRVAYIAECGGACGSLGDPYHGIRILDVKTGANVLAVAGDGYRVADLSPDCGRILYATQPDGRVFVAAADGSHPTPLAGVFPGVNDLTWSPDGAWFAYTSDGKLGIYLYSFTTSRSTLLGAGSNPDWSPDGNRIAFADQSSCSLWVMGTDGLNRSRIADLSQAGTGDCHSGLTVNLHPTWSPDGQQIAVVAFGSVFVMRVDGSGIHRVAANPGPFAEIAWRPVL